MNIQTQVNQASTFQQWSSFLTVLNAGKNSEHPLLHRSESANKIALNLEKQLPKIPQPAIFRRLGRHRQLSLNFS